MGKPTVLLDGKGDTGYVMRYNEPLQEEAKKGREIGAHIFSAVAILRLGLWVFVG